MTVERVDMFIMSNQKYLPPEKIGYVRDKLLSVDESRFPLITSVEMKDPTTMLLVSIFLGSLGVDRFMMGDTAMGVLKLLTLGVCGILTIIDWFSVSKKTKEMNYSALMAVI